MAERGPLLFLTPELPDRDGTGGAMREWHLLRGLAAAGWDLCVVAAATADAQPQVSALEGLGATVLAARRPADPRHEVSRAVARRPALAPRLVTASWLGWQTEVFATLVEPLLARALRVHRPRAVVLEHDYAVGWLRRLPHELPAAVAFENVSDRLSERLAAAETGVLHVRHLRDARAHRRELARAAPRIDRAFACSEDDAALVRERIAAPCDVVPNGVDLETIHDLGDRPSVPGRLHFAGTLSYGPNAEAVQWFVQEVLPAVREAVPEAHLEVLGRGASDELLALGATPGVHFAGRVPSVAPYLEEASVAIAPMLTGSGTNLKVVESLASGRPVVSTPIGAEGLGVLDGEHLSIAPTAAEFAQATVDALRGGREVEERARRGAALARHRFGWASIAADMDRTLRAWLA